jgi:MFS transporter, DHA1 family, inner membrane transport protein
MTRKELILLILLAAISFTHILDFMIMMPLGEVLMPHFRINAQQFSILVASYSVMAGISGFTAAFFVDNFDRKKVLLFGYTGFIVGTLLCGVSPTYEMLMMARIMAGLFGGLISAQMLSIVSDSFPYEKRGRAMGIVFTGFSVASSLGVPIGLFLTNWINWHATFIVVGGLGVIIIPLVIRFMPPMTGHLEQRGANREPVWSVVKEIVGSRKRITAFALSASLMMGHFIIIPFMVPYFENNIGFTKTQTPFVYLVGGIATLFASPYIGKLTDKHGKLRVFTIFVITSLIPVIMITQMPSIPFYYVLIVTGIWFILSMGRGIPANAMISNVVESKHRGMFMSFNGSIQQLFVGLASLVAGLIVIKTGSGKILHYDWVGYISAAIVGSSLIFARRLEKK